MSAGRGRALAAALWSAALLVWGAAYAYWQIFGTIMTYDDEGTLLLSVREVEGGSALYDQVFSAYGPFHFAFRHIVHGVLGTPLTHDATRLWTIVLWLASAAAAALFVRRVTGSLLVASVVYLQLVLHATTFALEPGHPQELCILLLSATLLLFAYIDARRPAAPHLALLGALLAALALTKVNLGALLGVSLLFVFGVFAADRRWRAAASALATLAALALPPLLMRQDLHTGWVRAYALLVVSAWAALALAALRAHRTGAFTLAHLAITAGGLFAAFLATVGFTLAHGSSPAAMLDAVAIAPLRFPTQFLQPGRLTALAGGIALPANCAVACAAALLFARAPAARTGAAGAALGAAKLAFAGVVLFEANRGGPWLLAAALPWLWLAVPAPAAADPSLLPRVALGAIAALQALQAYPIGGSQLAWATFLLVPAAGLCAADAAALLIPARWRVPAALRRAATAALFACAALFYAAKGNVGALRADYTAARPLELPGAERLRVAPYFAGFYHWWVANLRAHCDAFLAIPGYPSFYLWTAIPPLTGFNAGGWAQRFGDDLQERILSRAQGVERLCVLRKTSAGLYALPSGGTGPLLRHINTHLQPAFTHLGHALLVAPERLPLQTFLAFGQRFAAADRRYATLPGDLFPSGGDRTVSAWFRTTAPGVLLGAQSNAACDPFSPPRGAGPQWAPLLYVGTDGRLRGHFGDDAAGAITSLAKVDDGRWHHVALSRHGGEETLSVDGQLAGTGAAGRPFAGVCAQVGVGYTAGWPAGNGDWLELDGDIAEMQLAESYDAAAAAAAFTRGPRFVAVGPRDGWIGAPAASLEARP